MRPVNAHQFAFFELHIKPGAFFDFGHAEVAVDEVAFFKATIFKRGFKKLAMLEGASSKRFFGERLFCAIQVIEGLVFKVGFL